ncbi:MAG: hypothetical protein ACOY0T_30790 [Myxococcota bacterium]
MNVKQQILPLLGLALCALASGCSSAGEVPGNEPVSATIEELSQACGAASVQPNVAGTGMLNFETTRTYSNAGCWRAIVADVNDLSLAFVEPGHVNQGWVELAYNDTDLTTPAACADALVGGYIFEKQGSSWVAITWAEDRGGSWGTSGCFGPRVLFMSEGLMFAGRDYRFAFTARRISSNVTRRLKVTMVPSNDEV